MRPTSILAIKSSGLAEKLNSFVRPLEPALFRYILNVAQWNALAKTPHISSRFSTTYRYFQANYLGIFRECSGFVSTPLDVGGLRKFLSAGYALKFHNVNAMSATSQGQAFIAHFGNALASVKFDISRYSEEDSSQIESLHNASDALLEIYRICNVNISQKNIIQVNKMIQSL